MKSLSLYIHIPFCEKKCYYCDFASYSGKEHLLGDYVEALKKEIELYKEELGSYSIKTIFIGGGTPSILSAEALRGITDCLQQCCSIPSDIEISMEANPGVLNIDKLKGYYEAGINRLSMGLQACQDHLLKNLGRIHRYEDFIRNLQDARKVGFENINVDLMFGLHNQTLEDWKYSLESIVDLGVPHISAYSLIIEENTPFDMWMEEGKIEKSTEDLELAMYRHAIEFLKEKGYRHYEISNFAKHQHQCQHNITYWKNQSYLGLGVGAHSYLQEARFNNFADISTYIKTIEGKKKPIENTIILTLKDQISETMFLGLRMTEGVSVEYFHQRFKQSPFTVYEKPLDKLKKQGLITYDDKAIKLTDRGLNLANVVFQEMLLDE
ncbi:MAG: oxygen-independent coproporphyrinogen III oxidase [Clostridiaceae bacterium]|nr:oxygen-independent coproporphyrinogen III oxidase [Clostridiaceae bacterium]